MGSISRFNKAAGEADEGIRSEASKIYLLLKDERLSEEQKRKLKADLDKILDAMADELKAASKKEKDRAEGPPF